MKKRSDLFRDVLSKLDRYLDRYVEKIPERIDLKKNRALAWDGDARALRPLKRAVTIDPALLIGIDGNKDLLYRNTEGFILGKRANNVLLWGERGSGKSSLVKSLLTRFADTPLRMVHVLKHDILTIQSMYDHIAAHDANRFILFIDDLSFEEGQTDYKELKTIMDGGLEEVPANLLFYATSNRKNLVPTKFSDREFDEIRPSDTIEEKVSLADRFGLRLSFPHISQETYLDIVSFYVRKYGVTIDDDTMRLLAVQWAMESGGRNGRIAEQFVRNLVNENGAGNDHTE